MEILTRENPIQSNDSNSLTRGGSACGKGNSYIKINMTNNGFNMTNNGYLNGHGLMQKVSFIDSGKIFAYGSALGNIEKENIY